jgi:hypothetical protein
MKRIVVPTRGTSDWRALLADPENQWQRKASALELAVSWERANESERGIPIEVARALDQCSALKDARLLVAMPEHKVALKGRGKASQTDVWALLNVANSYVSMAVEGKAGEPFASTLDQWFASASDGKKERLQYLCELLQVDGTPPLHLRYQLFHRTASAIIEARRFNASIAVMLVQSFRDDPVSWGDFGNFCALLGATAVRGGLVEARRKGAEHLFLGWVDSNPASDSEIASVV